MPKVRIRPQELSDAERFFEIIMNTNMEFLEVPVKTLEDEECFMQLNEVKRRKHLEYNYSILLDGKLVGACGLKIDQHRPYIGEIGYFVDEACQGREIATEAVKLLEKIGFEQFCLQRIIILLDVRNRASERVAQKCGYENEGVLKKVHKIGEEFHDCFLYAKTA
ncbi:MAG: GNAT family N-acetyltransferase [Methanosarcinaceae archaeon]